MESVPKLTSGAYRAAKSKGLALCHSWATVCRGTLNIWKTLTLSPPVCGEQHHSSPGLFSWLKPWEALESGSPCSSVNTVVWLLEEGDSGEKLANKSTKPTRGTPSCIHPDVPPLDVLLKKLKGISSGNLTYCALRCFLGAQRGTFASRNWNSLFEEQGG